ncbi:hypothetical protein SRHO_G00144800 [Serrasalmus rhombeus]
MPSSKAAPSHDALLVPEDKRTVAKIPAEFVVIDLDMMLGHSLLKGVRSAQRISLCLWRLRRPHTAAHGERRKAGDERWSVKELSCLSQEPKTLILDESSTLRALFQGLHLMDDGEFGRPERH